MRCGGRQTAAWRACCCGVQACRAWQASVQACRDCRASWEPRTPPPIPGSPKLDIRQWHTTRDGVTAPGKKGIGLTGAQLLRLLDAAPVITAQVSGQQPLPAAERPHGSEPAHGSAPPPGPAAAGQPSLQASSAPKPAARAAKGSAAPGPVAAGTAAAPQRVDLGNMKQAEVIEFKGRRLLSLREFYEVPVEGGDRGIGVHRGLVAAGSLVAASPPVAPAARLPCPSLSLAGSPVIPSIHTAAPRRTEKRGAAPGEARHRARARSGGAADTACHGADAGAGCARHGCFG